MKSITRDSNTSTNKSSAVAKNNYSGLISLRQRMARTGNIVMTNR